ncbi:hypothetical protein VOLCADRAFT_105829 [Volvox carteri f. nagariensis]|uniref:Uncharacterized protein n=1 Tax=Volvox carteri f. nagariensis TaxID=3068 RepID=D8U3F0_VOLCA|nr:uncharacterized protein VOLCADRAFT_105829 [Volvox carteri f. nagariensis]EFJ45741.1 hypothetical protein VOLCADRAFT_105829 [Volvox carteri f. nagariensis]|eukprot:XP_002953142.1 hypothetical protein VOLCADRAFT_105829 [Volvox carteri f. nagariensis]
MLLILLNVLLLQHSRRLQARFLLPRFLQCLQQRQLGSHTLPSAYNSSRCRQDRLPLLKKIILFSINFIAIAVPAGLEKCFSQPGPETGGNVNSSMKTIPSLCTPKAIVDTVN